MDSTVSPPRGSGDWQVAELGPGVSVGLARSLDGLLSNAELAESLATTLVAEPTSDRRAVYVPDLEVGLAELVDVFALAPLAATVAATLLRLTSSIGVAEGLIAESLAYSMLQGGPEFATWLSTREHRPTEAGHRVTLERIDETLSITLDRGDKHNALDRYMREALLDAFAIAAAEPSLRIEIRGEGASFCSGGDLDEFGSFANPVAAHLLRTERSLAGALHALSSRTSVHLHGFCAGAGIELPCFASHVSASNDTQILLPELRLGLIPGAGGSVSLPRRIGRWRTMWMLLSARPIDAQTALGWGLIDEIV